MMLRTTKRIRPVWSVWSRVLSSEATDNLRNIGISAHIDSGKTTLTERILFYSGRINAIHDVRGKDGVGAKMDSMELERERGITIQSAATYTTWGESNINIIDTPGHVDFTVEVERALRVLDGAVMVLCGVAGVQSQSITVDRQMKRYNVPRVAFINKLDRMAADPFMVIGALREKLALNAAAVQLPIGLEADHAGVVDIVRKRAIMFKGDKGEVVDVGNVPEDMQALMDEKRTELIERLAEVDAEIEELFLMEEEPSVEQLVAAIRRATIARTLVPVFMGSAFKNKGVQPLLDGVVDYLPKPTEIENTALDLNNNEEEFTLEGGSDKPLVALAFKLEEGRFGQLTYMRVYQGTLKKGGVILNVATNKKVKVPRLVRMHSDDMEDVAEVGSGEICALFGVECSSGDTFTAVDNKSGVLPSMTSMFVPEPVMSLAVSPKDRMSQDNFSKAVQKFLREDPTFRVAIDPESKETIMSGMGELHLEVYLERMRREYNVDTVVGAPRVNYRETVTKRADFDYLHKKQSGGSGQYGRVVGYIAPLDPEIAKREEIPPSGVFFENQIVGNAISPEYVAAVGKGFEEAAAKGELLGHQVNELHVVLTDGVSHSVDSSELAFKAAARGAFRQAFMNADPVVIQPIMEVEVSTPDEYQGSVVGNINRRKGNITSSEAKDGFTTVTAQVPLAQMFGYNSDLRTATSAKGEFTMEFKDYERMNRGDMEELIAKAKGADAGTGVKGGSKGGKKK